MQPYLYLHWLTRYITRKLERALKQNSPSQLLTINFRYITRKLERALKHDAEREKTFIKYCYITRKLERALKLDQFINDAKLNNTVI